MFRWRGLVVLVSFLLNHARLCALKDVFCNGNTMRRLPGNEATVCLSTSQVFLCQAIREGGVYLECLQCDNTTKWTQPETQPGGKRLTNTTSNNTLYVPVGDIKPGCYYCSCESPSRSMNIKVTVETETMLTFMYNFSDGHIMLTPDDGALRITDPGYIYMFCNASGYPDPRYDWMYVDDDGSHHPYTDDKCLRAGENGKYLIFTPCPLNTGRDKSRFYQCTVYNGVSNNISTSKRVSVDITDWVLRVHPRQSNSSIPLIDGVARGLAVVYNDWKDVSDLTFDYAICRIPANLKGLNASSLPTCLYDQLNCCSCNLTGSEPSCPHFNLTSYGKRVTDADDLYRLTTGCQFEVKEEMDLAMFATRCDDTTTCRNISLTAVQLIGISRVRLPSTGRSASDNSSVVKYVAIGIGPVIGCIVGILCGISACIVYRKQKGKKGYSHLPQGSVEIAGGGDPPGDVLVAGVLRPQEQEQPGPVCSRVQRMHRDLIARLNIDHDLLAALHQEGLLSNVHRQSIHSMISAQKPPVEIASYFTNRVLFSWPPQTFAVHLKTLANILAEHSHLANKDFAEQFNKILSDYPEPHTA